MVQNAANKGFFYIVKTGLLKVDSEHRLNDKALSQFGPGDSFGLVSALTGHKFLVTVFAAEDSQVVELPVANFGEFLKKQKSIAMGMLRLYSNELKAIHKYLSMVNPVESRFNSPSRLPLQAEEYIAMGRPEYARYALEFFVNWSKDNPDLTDAHDKARGKMATLAEAPAITREGNILKLQPEQIIFLENEISKEIYVITSGHVRLSTLARGQELLIDVLGPGEIFGEMSFVDQGLRMASAIADDECEVMKFSPETLFEGVGALILQRIFISLARRIWFSHQRLVILRINDPAARLYAFVYNLIRNAEISSTMHNKAPKMEFNMGLEGLKKMCGLLKVSNEKIASFTKDSNLVITDVSIRVNNRKYLEDRVAYLKTKAGQISADLV